MRTKEKYLTHKTSEHLDKKQKKDLGSFWTPPEIALKMAKQTNWKQGQTVIDSCCGGGNLLAAMMDTFPELQEENLYGVDIDGEAVKQCIELFPYGHFQIGDCLNNPIDNTDFWSKPPFELWNEEIHEKSFKFGI